MADDKATCTIDRKPGMCGGAGTSNGVYGLAFIGAAIYFIQHATGFWMGVLGVLKAMIWPALLIYKALESLNM